MGGKLVDFVLKAECCIDVGDSNVGDGICSSSISILASTDGFASIYNNTE